MQIKFLFIYCLCFYFSWRNVGNTDRLVGGFNDWFMYYDFLHDEISPILWRTLQSLFGDSDVFAIDAWSYLSCDFVVDLSIINFWSELTTLSSFIIDFLFTSVRFYPFIISPNFFGDLWLSYLKFNCWVLLIKVLFVDNLSIYLSPFPFECEFE